MSAVFYILGGFFAFVQLVHVAIGLRTMRGTIHFTPGIIAAICFMVAVLS